LAEASPFWLSSLVRAGLGDPYRGSGRLYLSPGLIDARFQLAWVDFCQHLALGHLIVDVDRDLRDPSGDLRADVHRIESLEGPGGSDGFAQVPQLGRHGQVGERLVFATLAPAVPAENDGGYGDCRETGNAPEPVAPPSPLGQGEDGSSVGFSFIRHVAKDDPGALGDQDHSWRAAGVEVVPPTDG
jgi:hypothetical protein